MVAVAIEAGGLVKAAREWFRLQLGLNLVPAGCACGLEGKHRRLFRLGSVTLSLQSRYVNLYKLYGLQDQRSRRHLGVGT